jgi:hypothetical protein
MRGGKEAGQRGRTLVGEREERAAVYCDETAVYGHCDMIQRQKRITETIDYSGGIKSERRRQMNAI